MNKEPTINDHVITLTKRKRELQSLFDNPDMTNDEALEVSHELAYVSSCLRFAKQKVYKQSK